MRLGVAFPVGRHQLAERQFLAGCLSITGWILAARNRGADFHRLLTCQGYIQVGPRAEREPSRPTLNAALEDEGLGAARRDANASPAPSHRG